VAKLTVSEQRAIIGERLSKNSTETELSNAREKAMDSYYGRPMGNEIEGRAQVVSKDLMDTVEWIMPSLMRVFCTQEAVKFDPVGPEDEELAKQETAYVTHVIWKKNKGFMILYEWLKSALLQKNGYVKTWWQEEEKICFEEYTGLTEEQLVQVIEALEQQGKVKILGQEQDEYGAYAFKARIKKRYGCVKSMACPPEEVGVDKNCRGDIKTARFVWHKRSNVMRSELLEEGYSKARVAKLTSYDWKADMAESMARDSVGETLPHDEDDADKASGELELLECWTYLDADDDGIAEHRHYLLAGNDELENEECPENPFDSWTPIPVPFRHNGLSLYDLVEDLTRIKTALQRGLLDNVYFTNAPRMTYSRDVDVASLQVNRPAGHVLVNVNGPVAGHVNPMMVQPIADRLLPVIGYIDQVKEYRVGVGKMTGGVDADVLADSTRGAYSDAMSAANQRIEAIARIFAETGYSSWFSSTHRLLMRHQNWPERFKLKDKWAEVNPTEWQERANLTVSVGLGNASKEEIRANLGLMGQIQEKAAMVPGLIQPNNVFALVRRMQVELGFENENFITSPESPEYQNFQAQQGQQPPDPYIQGEQIKAQTRAQEKQVDASIKLREMAQDRDLAITKLEFESGVDLAKAGMGAEVAAAGHATRAVARGNAAQGARGAAPARKPAPAGGGRGDRG
jgi:hypothetical protein